MLSKFLLKYFGRLKFPWLFAVTALIFGIDLIIPDFIPVADELLLGMMTLLLGAWRNKKSEARSEDDPRIADPVNVDQSSVDQTGDGEH